MDNDILKFIQQNSPDGGFLQSPEWRKFQESVGRKTYNISAEGFYANVIEHQLPIVGKYFYVPRGPIFNFQFFRLRRISRSETIFNEFSSSNDQISKQIQNLINLAKKEKAGWVRIEPATEGILEEIKKNTKYKIVPAPHDMQPRELFMIDIANSEEEMLAGMKSKARYNIRLAEKKGVKAWSVERGAQSEKYIEEFIRLTKVMGERNKIATHPGNYYQKMFETIPEGVLKLYLAGYEGRIICANLVIFYGEVCTYLHGASDDEYRNVMAPFLLQWRQILDAKASGCQKYDFGGINTKTGEGITRFKSGFSPATASVKFPGCCDIVLDKRKYWLYRSIQKVKSYI
ncbi:MAG: peptidoglycan bridge formation glycyltransferase FemA/FemB family protein [Candidatus Pacebacteria bacterium]|nr:peptidoglycan bridge formation glycyltransferase FemA/FemB family protein [Candidatus Paceibacterota bacterium]